MPHLWTYGRVYCYQKTVHPEGLGRADGVAEDLWYPGSLMKDAGAERTADASVQKIIQGASGGFAILSIHSDAAPGREDALRMLAGPGKPDGPSWVLESWRELERRMSHSVFLLKE